MISLNVESYCDECAEFEPVCQKLFADLKCTATIVECEHRSLCAKLKKHIEQKSLDDDLK